MYKYKAEYVDNYDGDTINFIVDLGFNVSIELQIRLANINTYELRDKDPCLKTLAYEAKDFVQKVLIDADEIILKTAKNKKEKYGRYLAEVIYDGINLNEELLEIGYAVKYEK